MQFSANLGFLWTDLSLPDAIHAAKRAGFHAVECHWPFETPAADVARALDETGLPMLSLNTPRGDVVMGEFGLAALPGREPEARDAIDQALDYAREIGARNVHVMSGKASGAEAGASFVANLRHACDQAVAARIGILIEPINAIDVPGYFLDGTTQALRIMDDVGADNLALMFDCYHVQLLEGDLTDRLRRLLPRIGHIQVASVPDRGPPDHGEVDYDRLFDVVQRLDYRRPIGAEYRPQGDTAASLGWMRRLGVGQSPGR